MKERSGPKYLDGRMKIYFMNLLRGVERNVRKGGKHCRERDEGEDIIRDSQGVRNNGNRGDITKGMGIHNVQ